MATHRYVSTNMWTDPWFQSLDPSQKFLYLYCITNHCTNIAGFYKISIKQICFDTGYNEDTIRNIFLQFHEDHEIEYYKNYLIVNKFCENQKLKSQKKDKISNEIIDTESNVKKGIDEILCEIPNDVLTWAIENGYVYEYMDAVLERKGLKKPLEGDAKGLEGASDPIIDSLSALLNEKASSNNLNLSNKNLKNNINKSDLKNILETEANFIKENIDSVYHKEFIRIFKKKFMKEPENAHSLTVSELQKKYGIKKIMLQK